MPTDHYLLSDLLYRSRALTDGAGAIGEAYDTDAYGNTLVFNAPGTGGDWWDDNATPTSQPVNAFVFTGRRCDPETEIYFYRARYYVPEQGRFVSRDPQSYGVRTMYLFVGAHVVTSLDPTGERFAAWAGVRPLTPNELNRARAAICVLGKLALVRPRELAQLRAVVGGSLFTGTRAGVEGETAWFAGEIIISTPNYTNLVELPAQLAHEITHYSATLDVNIVINALEGAGLPSPATAIEDRVRRVLSALQTTVAGYILCCPSIDYHAHEEGPFFFVLWKLDELYCECGLASTCSSCPPLTWEVGRYYGVQIDR